MKNIGFRSNGDHVLTEYMFYNTGNHTVCNKEYNDFLRCYKKLMDMIIAHGANIYRNCISFPKDDPGYAREYYYILRHQILMNNLIFNRELSYGIAEISEKSQIPAGNRDYIDFMKLWIDFMKPYYEKDNQLPFIFSNLLTHHRKDKVSKIVENKVGSIYFLGNPAFKSSIARSGSSFRYTKKLYAPNGDKLKSLFKSSAVYPHIST